MVKQSTEITAKNLRKIADIVNNKNCNILNEIKVRALNGYYNDAGRDVLTDDEIKLLKVSGFKVTIGQDIKNPWFVIEW